MKDGLSRTPQGEVAQGAHALRLSLVIPAWNEQETIRRAIREAAAALAAVTGAYEILIVDDGSTDGTADAVRAEAALDPRVRLLQHPCNRGYGAALRTGFQAASLDLVAFTDADCQFDLTELADLLPLARRHDIVCGYRVGRQDPALRRFLSRGYNVLARLLLGNPVRDIDCALKVFRREALPAVLPESDNFFANTEMLARAAQAGLSVGEVGVRHRPRAAGRSKVCWRDVPRTLSALLPFWWGRTVFTGPGPAAARYGGPFWAALLLVAVVAGALLFPHLSYPLLEPDEGRYAEIGREMLDGGDWVVPTFNHRPYYDKPPLLYWLEAASLWVFGTREWAARVVPAGAAFLTVLATFLFAWRRLGPRAGLLAGLVLALMPGFVQCGRILILDGLLTLWVSLAVFAAHEAVQGRRLRRGWWLASAACAGLGVLTKGPVALVLVGPPVIAFGWLHRFEARPRLRHWAAYAGVALGLSAPWFVALTARDPGFAYLFFVEHHLSRFFGGEYHASPWWFYVPVLLVGCLPWSFLLVSLGRFLSSRAAAAAALRPPALGLCVLWAAWGVLFFSLSRGKLPTYIVPILPALAVLAGAHLEPVLFGITPARLGRPGSTWAPWAATATLAALGLGVGVWAWSRGLLGLGAAPQALAVLGVCLAALGWAARASRARSAKAAWLVCGTAAFALLLEIGQDLLPAWAERSAPLPRTAATEALVRDPGVGVACWGEEWGSVAFRLDRAGRFQGWAGRYGDEITQFLKSHRRILLLVRPGLDAAQVLPLVPAGMEMRLVFDTARARGFFLEAVPGGTPDEPAEPPPCEPAPRE
jgi:dolichol-phosphate mannosyltransferase